MSTTYPDVLHGAPPAVVVPPTSGRPAAPPPPEDRRQVGRGPAATRGALGALLLLTALGYLWGLGASGYANSFYAAAVQAGTKSWKAFLFGSIDPSNFITVDKPPASLWLMELSGRVFGFSSWSMLVPEALAGVAAVALVHATVRRWFGSPAGLVAGAVMAATPVAALMFRFNNPDALLVLLLVASAYTLTRAVERAGTRWVVATGALLGLAFLTKMLQAFTVLPAMAAVYAVAAPTSLRRRLLQLAAGGVAIAVSAGWWVATVALWPAGSRPMIDGSSDNSIINLILGYNGLGRLYSSSASGGGGAGGNFSGATGVLRLFNSLMGGQASWLLPAALVVVAVGLAGRIRAPRIDRTRAALILWGGWLVVTGAVFSFGQGVIHTYYTVALAPAIAALVGIGVALAWEHRRRLAARLAAAAAVAGSAAWAYVLLDRTPAYHPWLRAVVAVSGAVGAAATVAAGGDGRVTRRIGAVAVGAATLACLAGPVAYTATTVATPHTGSVPSAGPATAGGVGGATGPGAGRSGGPTGAPSGSGGTPPSAGAARPAAGGARPAAGGSAAGGSAAGVSAAGVSSRGSLSTGGALTAALRADAGRYRWVAATLGSQSAANLELASGEPVMAIGGFNGQGGNLSLATFESDVAKGYIHWFIASSGGGGGGGSQSSSAITTWVAAHFTATTIGGQTVYNLSSRTA